MTRPSGLTLAIIAVAATLGIAIAGPYLPSAADAILGLFRGKAELTGEIFVTMKSGDVKRGADVEVGLVRVDGAFQSAWDAILRDYERAMDEGLARVNQARARAESINTSDFRRSFGAQMAVFDEKRVAIDEWKRATDVLSDVPAPFQQRARALIGPNLVTTVRGNADGRYAFKSISPGRYYVIAQHQIFDNHLKWAVPITLNPGENTLSLTNTNGSSPIP